MKTHPLFSFNGLSIEWMMQLTEFQLPEWDRLSLRFIVEWASEQETIEVQTSGSTGEPTVWRARKSAMEASAQLTARYFNCYSGTNALLALPTSFIAGKMMLARAMTLGWRVSSVMPSGNPLAGIKSTFDFAAFTPMQMAAATDEQLDMLAEFGTVIIGGAPVSKTLRERLSMHCSNLYETYGMAETLSHIAVRKISKETIPFQTLEGIKISVDSESRLQILAPHIQPQTLQTQDVVTLESPTSFLFLGRYDRMINSGGIKLFAEAIEKKLEGVLQVPYLVGSLPDELLGQRLVLYIESDSNFDQAVLKEELRNVLERYEMPKEIISVPVFERTTSGKIKQIRN